MKTAREKFPILGPCDALKRFIAEYRNFDAATRLCADYCITAEGLAALMERCPKHEESESHLTFTIQSIKITDEAHFAT
ncbi:MAG: hypothetical protein ACREAB_14390 [Blastocatellia bacterium]